MILCPVVWFSPQLSFANYLLPPVWGFWLCVVVTETELEEKIIPLLVLFFFWQIYEFGCFFLKTGFMIIQIKSSCSCSFPVSSQFLIHISFISIFHFFHFIFENNHINKKAWAQTNQILYQHYASKLQKFSHCKFKHEKPDLIKEHNKAREIHNDTYPRPFISSSADPCFLVRPDNAKAFS